MAAAPRTVAEAKVFRWTPGPSVFVSVGTLQVLTAQPAECVTQEMPALGPVCRACTKQPFFTFCLLKPMWVSPGAGTTCSLKTPEVMSLRNLLGHAQPGCCFAGDRGGTLRGLFLLSSSRFKAGCFVFLEAVFWTCSRQGL